MPDAIEIEQMPSYLEQLRKHFEVPMVEPAMTKAVEILQDGFAENFETQSSPSGPWAPRKDSKPHPLLNESGALANAASGSGPGAIAKSNDYLARVGVDKSVVDGGIPGAAVHNFGYPPKNIPQREWCVVSEERIDDIEEEIIANLEAGMP